MLIKEKSQFIAESSELKERRKQKGHRKSRNSSGTFLHLTSKMEKNMHREMAKYWLHSFFYFTCLECAHRRSNFKFLSVSFTWFLKGLFFVTMGSNSSSPLRTLIKNEENIKISHGWFWTFKIIKLMH